MITDDPGTPGNGRYEINIATLLDRTSNGSAFEAPLLDINYGVGERLQLKIETPFEIDTAGARRSGIGNGLAGVKWRFVDGGDAGWNVSTYPQIEFNYPGSSSARRGLADRGTGYFLPVEMQRQFGMLEFDIEVGRTLRPGDDTWSAGIVIGHKLSEIVELMAEVHDERQVTTARSETLYNIGSRVTLSRHVNLLFSAGRDMHNSIGEAANLLVYAGVQLEL